MVTYDVVITVDNSDLKLFPGMTANVTILAAKLDDTLKVPNSVLRFRPSAAVLKKTGLPAQQADKQQVYVLAGGKLEAVPARFGLSDGRYTAISFGPASAGRAGCGEGDHERKRVEQFADHIGAHGSEDVRRHARAHRNATASRRPTRSAK